jgi:hypothetical protein
MMFNMLFQFVLFIIFCLFDDSVILIQLSILIIIYGCKDRTNF